MYGLSEVGSAVVALKDTAAAVVGWWRDRLSDFVDYLSPSSAPPTDPVQPDYTPPYTGGQCLIRYRVGIRYLKPDNTYSSTSFDFANGRLGELFVQSGQGRLRSSSGESSMLAVSNMALVKDSSIANVEVVSVAPDTGQPPDTCGNLPNPNAPYSPDTGVVDGDSPDDGDETDLVYNAAPLVTVGGLLSALQAIATAIKAISDAVDGIRKIGDAIENIKKLLDKLFGDKEKEDKRKPENRECWAGQWHKTSSVDGYISLAPIYLGTKEFIPYAIEFAIQDFPSTASRVLGQNSPSICLDSQPLLFLSWQDATFGITSIKKIQVLHSMNYIPRLSRGAFYNFRLNPSITAKFRLFYSSEPETEEAE